MSIDTYVYAMVRIHCKDQCTAKTEKVRGCNHRETSDNFCPDCGKKMWVKNKTETCLSDKLEHLQLWHGNEEGDIDESALSMIYSPMCGPVDFVVGKVLEDIDSDMEGAAAPFNIPTDEEYMAVYEETKAVLEPLGLWKPEKFGYLLYAICM